MEFGAGVAQALIFGLWVRLRGAHSRAHLPRCFLTTKQFKLSVRIHAKIWPIPAAGLASQTFH